MLDYSDDRYAVGKVSWIGWLLGDVDLAERAADAAAAHGLKPSTVAGCAAEAALAEGDWARAERHLLRRLDLGRHYARDCCAHAQLGTVYHVRGETDRAAIELLEAVRADPRCTTLMALRDRLGIATPVPGPWAR
jgi:uncharacterized protein HemY